MYHYPNYREENPERLIPVIQAYSLGLIISHDGERFQASHIPFMVERGPDGGWQLRGHMDCNNPQLAMLDAASVYIVFQGPNSYISPNVYVTRQLPTWNYVAVHVEGRCRVERPGLDILNDIARLAREAERNGDGWVLDQSEPRVRNLAPLIGRIVVDIERMEGRFKLSQEKSPAERQAATAHLAGQTPTSARPLLEELSFGRSPKTDEMPPKPQARTASDTPGDTGRIDEASIVSRVTGRLIPFLCLVYFFCFLDRVNVGFAALTMNTDLGLTATMFGFGTGVFFLGYVLFEIPSNLALRRFGARRWLARIMIAWGLISGTTAFASGPSSFYVIRFLLGVAEAGLLPGVIYYLACWVPDTKRAQLLGLFMVAIALSGLIGAPLSALLFKLDGVFGLVGWQWMFIIEATPAVVLGLVTLAYLPERPADASWLSPQERAWLQARMDQEERQRTSQHPQTLQQTFTSARVWSLGLVNFGLLVGLYTINFWLPQVIKEAGITNPFEVGLIAAIPALVGAVGMVAWSRRSDRSGERTWHLLFAIVVAIVGFSSAASAPNPALGIAFLTVAALGIYSALPLFWSMPTRFLSGAGLAAGLALINSISNVGGYVGPQLMGYIKDRTASFAPAFGLIACTLFVTAAIVVLSDLAAIKRIRFRSQTDELRDPIQQPDHA
ncbi:MFS transporter [Bradyrhizobium sp. CB82]|uniref:MFS transporter n=1 Tax=Bradyrhizobium sp. CB82 TaxID=3039159 RepID=UPI0024B08728|nr:MFS transporter [Bradyrhizobium sp. CB82]WFU43351.1 MFS transporter [Bradyrhizobium sp. CB82]